MKVLEYSVVVHKAEEGGYWLEVPALEGCFTQGETLKELMKNAREAIILYLEGLKELGKKIPKDENITVEKVRVAI
jgi:predicted RNase H-like HicB family nuclease